MATSPPPGNETDAHTDNTKDSDRSMKGISYRHYGGPEVLTYGDLPIPEVSDDRVLVRVAAASVNPYDWHMIRGLPYLARAQAGVRAPKNETPGADLAGTVEAVGDDVVSLKPGDRVFGAAAGAFAEFALTREANLAVLPETVSFEDGAATVMAATTALQALRDSGEAKSGDKVLVVGASGGIGTFAVQLARALGAEVTGVSSTRNLDLVRSLGAADMVDYTQEDFTKRPERYDVIIDNVGGHTMSGYRGVLEPDGRYVSVGSNDMGNVIGPFVHMARVLLGSVGRGVSTKVMLAKNNKQDLEFVMGLIETGEVTPVVDRSYPLAQVADAVAYVEEGHARGKVIITI